MTVEQLKHSLESALPGARVSVEDSTGTGDHFQVTVVASEFEGKRLIEQHQIVYQALQAEIAGDLHAIGLKTYSPDAWRRMQIGDRNE